MTIIEVRKNPLLVNPQNRIIPTRELIKEPTTLPSQTIEKNQYFRKQLKLLKKEHLKSIEVYNHVTSILKQKKTVVDIQQHVAIRLYNEIIEFSTSLIKLLEHHRVTGIETLLRVMVERYLFLEVVCADKHLAKSFHLKSGIIKIKTRMIKCRLPKDDNQFLDFTQIEMSPSAQKRLERLEKEYISGFRDGSLMDKWYNLNGKIQSMEKLMKTFNLYKEFSDYYIVLSQEVHSGLTNKTVKELIDADFNNNDEGYPQWYIYNITGDVLRKSADVISRVFPD